MATIFSPEYSFVKFADYDNSDGKDWLQSQEPGNEIFWQLPVAKENDLRFQIYVEAVDPPEQVYLSEANDLNATLRLYPFISNNVSLPMPPVLHTWPDATNIAASQYITKIQVSDTLWVFYVQIPLNGLLAYIEQEGCFQLAFNYTSSTDPSFSITGISNPMIIVPDNNWSSILLYRSSVDDYGFEYCADTHFANRVRLPFYLGRPSYAENKTQYIKSNGERIITKRVTYKQYPFVTGYMPEWAHDALLVATGHSFVQVDTDEYVGSIFREDDYDPKYPDFLAYPLGAVAFKVFAPPLQIKANNCGGECVEFIPCAILMLVGSPDWPDYAGGANVAWDLNDFVTNFNLAYDVQVTIVTTNIISYSYDSATGIVTCIIVPTPTHVGEPDVLMTITITQDGCPPVDIVLKAKYRPFGGITIFAAPDFNVSAHNNNEGIDRSRIKCQFDEFSIPGLIPPLTIHNWSDNGNPDIITTDGPGGPVVSPLAFDDASNTNYYQRISDFVGSPSAFSITAKVTDAVGAIATVGNTVDSGRLVEAGTENSGNYNTFVITNLLPVGFTIQVIGHGTPPPIALFDVSFDDFATLHDSNLSVGSPHPIGGLTPATEYAVYVMVKDTGGHQSKVGPMIITTP